MTDREQKYFEDLLNEKFKGVNEKLVNILEQTTETNGRVTKLEAWKDKISGGWYIVTLGGIVVGFIIGAAVEWFRG